MICIFIFFCNLSVLYIIYSSRSIGFEFLASDRMLILAMIHFLNKMLCYRRSSPKMYWGHVNTSLEAVALYTDFRTHYKLNRFMVGFYVTFHYFYHILCGIFITIYVFTCFFVCFAN